MTRVKGHELDLRVSTLPTIHGEGVVMRSWTVRASSSISTTWALARTRWLSTAHY